MVTKGDITALINEAQEHSISIYLPTHISGQEVQQDPIRFKNLLGKAEHILYAKRGMEQAKNDEMLEEPRDLLNNPEFWQHGNKGMAAFITPDSFKTYRVPLNFKEQVMVKDHFLITPLLPMITLNGTYCIAVLSQKKVRFLRCTHETVLPIELEDVPTSVEEFTRFKESEKHLQHHSSGEGRTVYHGQGIDEYRYDQELVNFLKV